MQKEQRGFTLIELLVVVLIIGILAAVAVPQYQQAVWKARIAEAVTAIKATANAEKVYFMENGTYTRDFHALDVAVGTPGTATDPSINYIQTMTNWRIKLAEIEGNSIYTQALSLAGGLYIYYYLDKDTFHCCFKSNNLQAQKICSGLGSSETAPCATDETLTCYPFNR